MASDFSRRADQYVQQGLLDVQSNANLIQKWFEDNKTPLPLTAAALDQAVAALRPQLAWKTTPTPAAPAAAEVESAEPAEVLQPWQLPLDADEYAQKHADVRALKDLIARRRAASNQQFTRRAGSFSAKF
jgi:hypothetical protein